MFGVLWCSLWRQPFTWLKTAAGAYVFYNMHPWDMESETPKTARIEGNNTQKAFT